LCPEHSSALPHRRARSTATLFLQTRFLPPRSFYLFLQCYGPHRAPHSFPTRRSSDLQAIPRRTASWIRRRSEGGLDRIDDVWHRSEEHTSELQSPCNLVCRLLLEKKNTTAVSRSRRVSCGHSHALL